MVATGELILQQTDLRLPERAGLGASLVRFYRSHVRYDGPFGPGWDDNLNQRVIAIGQNLRPQELIWLTGQRAIRFRWENDKWVPEAGAFYRLQMGPKQIFIENGRGMRWECEPSVAAEGQGQWWRIVRISTPHDQRKANVVEFRYLPNTDLLSTVEDPFGNQVRCAYDSRGRITGVHALGKTCSYRYEPTGRLIAVEVPQVACQLSRTHTYGWEYTYWETGVFCGWLRTVVAPGSQSEKQFHYEANDQAAGFGGVAQVIIQPREKGLEAPCWKFQRILQEHQLEVLYKPPVPLPEERWVFPTQRGRETSYAQRREIPARQALWQWEYNADSLCIREIPPSGTQLVWEYDS